MKLKAIFWDVDGVLVQSKHLFSEKLEQNFGIDIKKMLPFFLGVFRECGVGKADLKEELSKVIDDWGWKGTVDELLHYWFTEGTKIDEETLCFVKELHDNGLPSYIVTDNEKYRGEYLRRILKRSVVDRIFLSAELGCVKKTEVFWNKVYYAVKDIFQPHTLERNEILYIDDDKDNIDAARVFGLSTYLYDGDLDTLKSRMSQYISIPNI